MPERLMEQVMVMIEGESYEADFTRTWKEEVDPSWGADYDGNRGERRVFIEDDEASDIVINGVELRHFNEGFQKGAKRAVKVWMNQHGAS